MLKDLYSLIVIHHVSIERHANMSLSMSKSFALRQSIAQLLFPPALDVEAAVPFNNHAAVNGRLSFLQLALLRPCWAVLLMRQCLISALALPAPSLEPQGCASSLPTAAGMQSSGHIRMQCAKALRREGSTLCTVISDRQPHFICCCDFWDKLS